MSREAVAQLSEKWMKAPLPHMQSIWKNCSPTNARLSSSNGLNASGDIPFPRMSGGSRSQVMVKHRALEDTVQRARHYGAIAKDALALFPASPMKEALEEAVEFCICRMN